MSFLSALLSFFAPICLEHSKVLHLLVEVCLEQYLFIQRQQANQRKVCNNLAPNQTDFMKQIHVHIDTSKVLELPLHMYSVCYLAFLLYMCINYNMFRK